MDLITRVAQFALPALLSQLYSFNPDKNCFSLLFARLEAFRRNRTAGVRAGLGGFSDMNGTEFVA
jgi:hypothetical protein